MTALLQVLRLWHGETGPLVGGLVLTVISALALAALSASAGAVPTLAGGIALVVVLRGAAVVRVVLRYVERLATHGATFRALAAVRVWMFRGLVARSAGGLGFLRRGDALARLVGDVGALDGLYLRIIVPLVASLVLIPVLAVMLGRQNLGLAVGVSGLFAVAALIVPWLSARATLRQGVRLAEASAALRVAVVDALGGLREVRAFGNEGLVLAAVQAREGAQFGLQRVVAQRASLAQAAGLVCSQVALLVVVLEAPGALLPAVLLTLAVFEAAGAVSRAGLLAGYAAAGAGRVLEAAAGPAREAVSGPMPAGTGIRFEGVHYSWPGRVPTFDGLTLEIAAGSRVAILGPSGAGKSTLAALLLKVVVPQSGRVLMGGADLAGLPATDVRARAAWLSQATHVFADTVRANLLLGRPEADDAACWQALGQAGLAEVIKALPEGLDTWIGEGGAGLSGGQLRRVALARALLSPAPILILDEPATGLDDAAERAFYATLNEAGAGRTVILIVHRLLGVERLDRIWRLSGGRAVAAAG